MATVPSRAAGSRCRLTALVSLAAFLLLVAPAHTGRRAAHVSREVFLMGTRAVLSTWSDSRLEGLAYLERLLRPMEETEAQLSTWHADSEVSRLNASAGRGKFALSPSLCRVIATLEQWTRETGGAFDPAVGALTAAWDLHGRGRVPSRSELTSARRRSGWQRAAFDADACMLALPRGLSLDVGAFGKGEALDRARAAADPAGANREHSNNVPAWLIDLGGQVAVAGVPRGESGWDVSLAHPRQRDMAVLRLPVRGGSLATSGGSERDLRDGARRIGHILDPRTGRPAAFTGSVTVWHEEALAADVLSTALFVMGPEQGLQWADARGVAVVYLLTDDNGDVMSRASQAFRARFGEIRVNGDSTTWPAYTSHARWGLWRVALIS